MQAKAPFKSQYTSVFLKDSSTFKIKFSIFVVQGPVGFDENRERVGTVLIKQNREGKLVCKDNSFLEEKCLEEEFPVKMTR